KAIFSTVPEISFRSVPDAEGDSCTFISWFLPTEEQTRKFVAVMKEQGIMAGNFYWYDNNWHYIKKWQHLKTAGSLYNLNEEQQQALLSLSTQSFAASDAVMSRCISTAISLLWTDEQMEAKANKIVEIVKSIL
ncbi:unnamed protein product, partial [Rotaria sp. Silwood1]